MSTHLSQSTHMSQSESKCQEEQAVELVDKGKQKELPGMKRSGSADDVHLEQAEQPEKKRPRKSFRAAMKEVLLDPSWQKNARGEWVHVS